MLKGKYRKNILICLFVFLLGLIASCEGKTVANTQPEDDALTQKSYDIETPFTQGISNDEAVLNNNLNNEPPISEAVLSIPVPEFLDEEQQLLYRKAYSLYMHMFGGDTSDIEYFESLGKGCYPVIEYEYIDYNEKSYHVSQGRYSNWDVFNSVIHSIFTDNFWSERNAEELYINFEGSLCFLSAARGSGYYYNENFPDKFELVSKSDTEISFILIGHYTPIWPEEGYTDEEWEQKRKSTYMYTIEFPMKLILTESGWRFDEFHSALGDELSIEAVEKASVGKEALFIIQKQS